MLTRRRFLQAAGVCLPLPWLESFAAADGSGAKGPAAAPPGRAVFFMVPSGVNMWRWHPKEYGADFRLGETLSALEPFRRELTVFSGLEHAKGAGGGHYEVGVWLTGNANYKSKDGPVEPNTISIDQHIAGAIGGRTRIPSLVLSAPGGSVTTSFDAKGAPVNAENDLRRLYGELFGDADVLARLERRSSVLDLVGGQARDLARGLGRNDRRRFDDYLQSVRDVESRLQADRDYFSSRPLPISTSELALDADPQSQRQDWFRTLTDLVALALRADQTRIVSILACGSGHEFFGKWPEFGSDTHHRASHATNFDPEEQRPKDYAFLAAVDRWFVAHLARFLGRLADTQEGDGTLLSNTLVLYGGGMSWTHNPGNLPMLLAGGSRLGLRHGTHLRLNPHKDLQGRLDKFYTGRMQETTVCDLHRTLSERLGVPAPAFGDSRRTLDEILA